MMFHHRFNRRVLCNRANLRFTLLFRGLRLFMIHPSARPIRRYPIRSCSNIRRAIMNVANPYDYPNTPYNNFNNIRVATMQNQRICNKRRTNVNTNNIIITRLLAILNRTSKMIILRPTFRAFLRNGKAIK